MTCIWPREELFLRRIDMKRYMRGIVVMGPGKVEIVDDIPVPKPGDYDALVKVKSCGICSGTDLQYIDGTEKETLADYPTILKHERT